MAVEPSGYRLRPLWDFTDLDASEARLRGGLREETSDPGRAAGLERGRVLRLAGDLTATLPLFEEAFETARAARQDFIAGERRRRRRWPAT
jgi:hypothetical protein